VLLQDMLGHREEIGLWRADRLDVGNAQHAQIHFLQDIGHIRHVAGARQQEPAERLPMACSELRNE
jgi:hypothetical protein